MTTAIVNIGQLVTLAGPARPRVSAELRELAIVRDAALLIEDGRIAATGTYAGPAYPNSFNSRSDRCRRPLRHPRLRRRAHPSRLRRQPRRRVRAAHRRRNLSADRSPPGGGILRTVAATRSAPVEVLLNAARRHRDWMLRTGTTTMEAKSGYASTAPPSSACSRSSPSSASKVPRASCPHCSPRTTVPPEFADRRTEYVYSIAEDLIPEVASHRLARYCDAFCDDHAFTPRRNPHRARLRQAPRSPPPRPRRAVPSRHRRSLRRRARRSHRRPPRNRHRGNPPSAPRRRRAARASSRFRLRSRPHAVPARAENHRARARHRSRHRLQSRLLAHLVHAVRAFARLHSDGHVSR